MAPHQAAPAAVVPSHTPEDIAVIVPVGGAATQWARSAASLQRLEPAPGETIVVLDGPNHDLASIAAQLDATVVVLEVRGGPARARNRGALVASRPILVFIDSDVEVPTGLVASFAEHLSTHPESTAVIGAYDDSPADSGFFSQYRNLLHHFVHQNGRVAASTFWSGCGAVYRNVFVGLGGFDERYTLPSIEDIEFGTRLVQDGYSIDLDKDLQVKHLKKWHLREMLATDLMQRAVPWTELILRNGRMINDLNVKTRERINVFAAYALLAAVAMAWAWPAMIPVAAGLIAAEFVLNAKLIGFFLRRRGALFTAGAIVVHFVYLLNCGLGWIIGSLRHFCGRFCRPQHESR